MAQPPRPRPILTGPIKNDLRVLRATAQRDNMAPTLGVANYRTLGPDPVRFEGLALIRFQQISLKLAKSALLHGGPLPDVVKGLVVEFIRLADREDEDAAMDWLEAQLSAPSDQWTFVQGLNAHLRPRKLRLGSCTAATDLESLGIDSSTMIPDGLRPPFIAVTTEGRGETSARLVAIERIAEATALLALMSYPPEVPIVAHLLTQDGAFGYSTGQRGTLNVWRVFASGKLHPGYHELSDALARPENQRSDWEQRVASAARWWHKASTTAWPSEVLVAGMSALECLLMKPGEGTKKAALVSTRMTTVATLGGIKRAQQIEWLRGLYRRRNEALHGGQFYQDELDADRLLALVDLGVQWAVRHLDPWHEGTNDGPCTNIDEALGPHEEEPTVA